MLNQNETKSIVPILRVYVMRQYNRSFSFKLEMEPTLMLMANEKYISMKNKHDAKHPSVCPFQMEKSRRNCSRYEKL